MKLNRKGFTLVEILAVVAILGILVAFMYVNVNKLIRKNEEDNYKNIADTIKSAAKVYTSDYRYEITIDGENITKIGEKNLTNSQIPILDLVDEGNIEINKDGKLNNPKDKNQCLNLKHSYIKVTYNNETKDFIYGYSDTDSKEEKNNKLYLKWENNKIKDINGNLFENRSCYASNETFDDSTKAVVTKPDSSLCKNPYYNGEEQTLVNEYKSGHIYHNYFQKDIGFYEIKIELEDWLIWQDNSRELVNIQCEIKRPVVKISYKDSNCSPKYKEIDYEDQYGELCEPTKNGYIFGGWYDTNNYENQITQDNQVTNFNNHNIYAKWIPKTYTINLDNQAATTVGTSKIYGKYNSSIYLDNKYSKEITTSTNAIKIPQRTGYNFAGYYNNEVQIITSSGNLANILTLSEYSEEVTLQARWTPKTYTINLDNKDATTVGTTVIYGKYANGIYLDNNYSNLMTTSTNAIKIPQRTGYNFAGYYHNKEQLITSNGNLTSKFTTTKYLATVTLTAQWTPKTYTITLNNQAATTAGTTVIYGKYANGIYLKSDYSKKMSTSANAITVPKKTGYTFLGYYNKAGEQLIGKNGNITKDFTTTKYSSTVELTANWQINKVSISYKVNGGTITAETSNGKDKFSWKVKDGYIYKAINGGSSSKLVSTVNHGATYDLPNYNNSEYIKVTRSGYRPVTGKQWKCVSGCSKTFDQSKKYLSSDFCDTSTKDCSIVVQINWTNAYTIAYKENCGTNENCASNMPSNQVKIKNENKELSGDTPTRKGYTFVKWNTKSDGKGTTYKPNDTYKKNEKLTLYAIWKKN